MAGRGHIPDATVARLPRYLRSLDASELDGAPSVSSDELADLAGVNAAKVRKDLSYLGTHGTRGVGYEPEYLRFEIRRALGMGSVWPVVICGIGNLGSALAGHDGFRDAGFPVAAAVDSDPAKAGTVIAGVPVHAPSELAAVVAEHRISIGVIATPASAAQAVADHLVDSGIRSIMSFAPTVLTVPEDVELRAVDLTTELLILGFHLHRTSRPVFRRARAPLQNSSGKD